MANLEMRQLNSESPPDLANSSPTHATRPTLHLSLCPQQPSDFPVDRETRELLLRYAQAGNAQGIDSVLRNSDETTRRSIVNYAYPATGELLFHAAARSGSEEALSLLRPTKIDAKAGQGSRNIGMTALHIAARYGHIPAVNWLLRTGAGANLHQHGAAVNAVDDHDNTPLHHAVMLGHRNVAVALVKAGGCLHALNEDRLMPISYCKSSAMFDALVVLSSLTSCTEGRHGTPYSPVTSAVGDDTHYCEVSDSYGDTILSYAARFSRRSHAIANLIVRAEEESKAREAERNSADHAAQESRAAAVAGEWVDFLVTAAEVGNVYVLKALRHYVGHLIRSTLSARGEKAAHYALLNNQRGFLNKLLHMAEEIKVPICITLDSIIEPIREGIIPNLQKEKDGDAVIQHFPMYLLLYARHFQAFEFILDNGYNSDLTVNQWDEQHKRTCLHWAALHQRADIVEALLHGGDRWRTRAKTGRAVEEEEEEEEEETNMKTDKEEGYYERKRRRQPSPTIKDAKGKTAMQIAYEMRNQDVLDVMRSKPSFKDYEERLYKDRQLYVEGLHSLLVGAALIVGVSFAGWLQLPSVVFTEVSMKIFWASNALAFFTAAASMCISITELVPTPYMYIGAIVDEVRRAIVVDAALFAISLVSAAVAFAAAGFAAMHPSNTETAPPGAYLPVMWISTSIGLVLFVLTLFVFLVQFYRYFPAYFMHIMSRHCCCCCVTGSRGDASREFYPHANMADIRRQDLINGRQTSSSLLGRNTGGAITPDRSTRPMKRSQAHPIGPGHLMVSTGPV